MSRMDGKKTHTHTYWGRAARRATFGQLVNSRQRKSLSAAHKAPDPRPSEGGEGAGGGGRRSTRREKPAAREPGCQEMIEVTGATTLKAMALFPTII